MVRISAPSGHLFLRVVYTTRAAVPVMRKQKSGHIFQVSSVGGRLAVPGNTPYHAAKWAVGSFSDSLALEVAPFGIKVCTLEPGGIRTNWARRAGQNSPQLLPEYENSVGTNLKGLRGLEGRSEGDPRKIAGVILKLANTGRGAGAADSRCRCRTTSATSRAARERGWRNLDTLLFQRFLKMGASTVDCTRRKAKETLVQGIRL